MNNSIQDLKQKVQGLFLKHIVLFDRYQQILVWLVITIFLLCAIHSFDQPISLQQRHEVASYSTQYLYPHSRELSVVLINQPELINQYQYFKFLRVLYFEKNRIQFQKEES